MQVDANELMKAAIFGVCGFLVWFLKDVGASVKELNARMAVYVEKVTVIASHLEDHEERLRNLEKDDSRLLS